MKTEKIDYKKLNNHPVLLFANEPRLTPQFVKMIHLQTNLCDENKKGCEQIDDWTWYTFGYDAVFRQERESLFNKRFPVNPSPLLDLLGYDPSKTSNAPAHFYDLESDFEKLLPYFECAQRRLRSYLSYHTSEVDWKSEKDPEYDSFFKNLVDNFSFSQIIEAQTTDEYLNKFKEIFSRCPHCKKFFFKKRSDQKFCSDPCRLKFKNLRDVISKKNKVRMAQKVIKN